MLHSQIQEAVPLLALGGLDAAEQAQLEQHLDVCPACRGLLAEYQFVANELNAQTPPRAIPPDLETKLQRQLPAQNEHRAQGAYAAPRDTRAQNLWRQPARISRLAFVLVALIACVMAGTTAVFARERNDRRAHTASTQAYALENLALVPLTGFKNGPEGYMYVAPGNPTALLWLTNMAQVDETHAYQIWLVKNGQRTGGGTFRPGNDGRAIVFVNAHEPWGNYQEITVTIEPRGGSAEPTTPRVIGGRLP